MPKILFMIFIFNSIAMAVLEDHAAWIYTLLALLFILSFLLRRSKGGDGNKTNLPPGPFKLPIIGNMHQIGSLPHRSFRDLSRKHGPLMLLQLGSIPTLVVSSAEMAQEIMKTHDLDFANRPALAPAMAIFYECKDIAFAPYGEYWRKVKKICVLELLSNRRVQSFASVRDQEVSNMIKHINDSKGLVINLSEMLISLSNDIMCRVVLGKKYFGNGGEYYGNGFSDLLSETLALLGGFNFQDFFPFMGWMDILNGTNWKQRRLFRRWDEFFDQVIKDHLNNNKDENEQKDFVDFLLHAQKHSTLDIPLTLDNIKALILDLAFAAAENPSAVVERAMVELIRHPELMKKAKAEVKQVVGARLKVTEDEAHGMDYIRAIIKETLRLHPPAPLLAARESIRATKLQGYDIPAKVLVYINAFAIGRDPSTWEREEEFQPQRFINSKIDFKGQDFMFIPFGAGRRSCPGISYAVPVMELTLANLVHQFNWEIPNGAKANDLDMSEEFEFTVHKKIHLVAKPEFI